jgi:hypothetical protein
VDFILFFILCFDSNLFDSPLLHQLFNLSFLLENLYPSFLLQSLIRASYLRTLISNISAKWKPGRLAWPIFPDFTLSQIFSVLIVTNCKWPFNSSVLSVLSQVFIMNSILKDLACCYIERLDCVTHFLNLSILRIIVLIILSDFEVLAIRTNDNYMFKGL